MDIFILRKMCSLILLTQINNVAGAAERTHITASPFGKNVATLEDQIGYTLFTHKDNDISPNRARRGLYQKLFPVYQRLSAIDNRVHNASRRSQEVVVDIDNIYPTIIFDRLVSLGDRYNGVTVQAVEFSENGVIGSLFNHRLGLIISPRHVSPHAQELGNPAINELPLLRLRSLISRRYRKKQPQDLLRKLPRLQIRFQSHADFETMLDTCTRPCGIDPTTIYRPYGFMAKISVAEREQFPTAIPHFVQRLMNPSMLGYFDAPGNPVYIQEFLYSLKNRRYAATMLRYVAEDRDSSAG